MMPLRFLLLGRAFNETVFLGLDRGPWFYSPTIIINKYLLGLYLYTKLRTYDIHIQFYIQIWNVDPYIYIQILLKYISTEQC